MRNRNIKCFKSLPAQGSSAGICNGTANHYRQLRLSGISKKFLNGINCGLRIERVKNGLDQKQVNTAIHKAFYLFIVSIGNFVKSNGTKTRIIYIGREA